MDIMQEIITVNIQRQLNKYLYESGMEEFPKELYLYADQVLRQRLLDIENRLKKQE